MLRRTHSQSYYRAKGDIGIIDNPCIADHNNTDNQATTPLSHSDSRDGAIVGWSFF